jgi:hypothetical protein
MCKHDCFVHWIIVKYCIIYCEKTQKRLIDQCGAALGLCMHACMVLAMSYSILQYIISIKGIPLKLYRTYRRSITAIQYFTCIDTFHVRCFHAWIITRAAKTDRPDVSLRVKSWSITNNLKNNFMLQ